MVDGAIVILVVVVVAVIVVVVVVGVAVDIACIPISDAKQACLAAVSAGTVFGLTPPTNVCEK